MNKDIKYLLLEIAQFFKLFEQDYNIPGYAKKEAAAFVAKIESVTK